MRAFAASVALLSVWLLAAAAPPGAAAQEPPTLFLTPAGEPAVRTDAEGRRLVRVNPQALALARGDRLILAIPAGPRYQLEVTRSWRRGEIRSLAARLVDEPALSTVITSGPGGSFGRLSTPSGVYRLEPGPDGDRLFRPADLGQRPVSPTEDDAVAPERPPDAPRHAPAPPAGDPQAPRDGAVIIDLLIVYTDEMASRLGAALETRLTFLVDLTNTALANAATDVSFNYLGSERITVDPALPITSTLLRDLRDGIGPFAAVPGLRDARAADLVALVRPYDRGVDPGVCGRAFVNGSGEGGIPSWAEKNGYSISNDGTDVGGTAFFCRDNTFPHEVGHNLGNAHNREDAGVPGVFSYSYGYRRSGVFRTVMAYGSSAVETIFSTPAVTTCGGSQACGVPIGDAAEADNATSIRNVADDIAAFRSAATSLVANVLPASRSVTVGTPATAFASAINAGTATANGCTIAPITSVPASFTFQRTDPATNVPIGGQGDPVDMLAGAAQSFVIAFTPTGSFIATDVELSFDCTNSDPAPSIVGLNSLLLSASTAPVADVIAIAATPTGDGIALVPGTTGTGFFAVAGVNIGAAATLTVLPAINPGVPVTGLICDTTGTPGGACIAPASAQVGATFATGETRTFTVFLTGTGTPIPVDLANSRVSARFREGGGNVRGATNVAVQTGPGDS